MKFHHIGLCCANIELEKKLYKKIGAKNFTKTYIDRNDYNIEYEEQTININKFIARVIITKKLNIIEEFEWCEPTNSKKNAKQMAARIVLNKKNNNENDILIEIRDLLKDIRDKL